MIFSYKFNFARVFATAWIKQLFSASYYRTRRQLQSVKDSKKGKKAIIICNGPSLKKVNWEEIIASDVDTFGLNKINLLFEDTAFRPTYLVSINGFVVEQNADYFNETTIPTYIDSKHKSFVKNKHVSFIDSLPMRGFFAKDVSKGYCQGFTVTYAAMQLAYHMGYSEVALIGCDHYFRDKGVPNAVVESKTDDHNHFHPNYFGKGMKWQLPDILGSEFHYQVARDEYLANGRKLYNCTDGGYLDLIERRTLKDFLG